MMKARIPALIGLLILVMVCPAWSQLDLGAPDTVAMEVIVSPCAATSQLNVQMDLFVFNDSNTLMGLSVGFAWDNPNLHLDSTVTYPLVADNFDQVFLVDGDIGKTNDLKHFLFGGLSFFNGVPPAPERRLWASYYFSLDSWTQTDLINFDTLEYDGGTNFVAIDRGTTLEYVPVWAAGNTPITVTDCGANQRTAWYVAVDGDDEYGDGSPWDPFATIQAAIDHAENGDSVVVTPGTYTGIGNREVNFSGKLIRVTAAAEASGSTVIDCQNLGNGFIFESGETAGAVLERLTIRNGNGSEGGALHIKGSSPTIDNCVFENNRGFIAGVAQIFQSAQEVRFTNCRFENNRADLLGGALNCFQATISLTECVISGNSASVGGAIVADATSLTMDHCTVVGNDADGTSAITLPIFATDPITIANSIIANTINGTAITCTDSNNVHMSCCDLYGNSHGNWINCLASQLGQDGNIEADPMFCSDETGYYFLHEESPCAPGSNPECGLIGALPVRCGTPVPGDIWFVSVDGSDETGNGSVDNPFATIQFAVEQSSNGDSVRVLPGEYFESINYGGRLIAVHAVEGPLVTTITNERRTNLVMFDHGEDSRAVLEGFTLQGGWMAILCSNSGPIIRHNIIRDQNVTNWAAVALAGKTGINYDPNGDPRYTATFGPSPAKIINNTIAYCANGGISSFSTEAPTIMNTIIAFNSNYGFHQQSPTGHPQPLLSYNDVFGNPFSYHNILDVGTGTISADPQFTPELTLRAGSPCIDAGDPGPVFDDPDGSRNDMGAVPGEGGPGVIPTDEWINIYCGTAFLDRGYLPVGSVIRAYDPTGVMCGMGVVREDHSFGFIPIYHDDIYSDIDEGAELGDLISFTVDGKPVVTNVDVIWTENGDSYELCQFFTQHCCTIRGGTGWTLVSWNVAYTDDIESFVGSHAECFDVVLSFEQGGLTYDPALPEFSTLQEVDYHHGYWIRDHCSYFVEPRREICGQPIPTSESISLEYGWNVVAYWPGEPWPTEVALGSVMDNLLVATGFEYGAKVYMPDGNGFNTLTEMKPGLGYWVKSDTPTLLTYPGFGLADSVPAPYNAGLAVHRIQSAGQGAIASREWMSAYGKGITLDGAQLEAGDRIEFFTDEGVLCGSSLYGDGLLRFTPIYGRDGSAAFSKDYPGPGDRIQIRVNGDRVLPDIVWEGEFARVALGALATSPDNLVPERYVLAQNYPNPFNPGTTIKYGLPTAGDVRLTVYNVLGQTVRTLVSGFEEAGQHEVIWDGVDDHGQSVSSGVYLYRLDATGFSRTRKMILMK